MGRVPSISIASPTVKRTSIAKIQICWRDVSGVMALRFALQGKQHKTGNTRRTFDPTGRNAGRETKGGLFDALMKLLG
jgi:hypothetical protein